MEYIIYKALCIQTVDAIWRGGEINEDTDLSDEALDSFLPNGLPVLEVISGSLDRDRLRSDIAAFIAAEAVQRRKDRIQIFGQRRIVAQTPDITNTYIIMLAIINRYFNAHNTAALTPAQVNQLPRLQRLRTFITSTRLHARFLIDNPDEPFNEGWPDP